MSICIIHRKSPLYYVCLRVTVVPRVCLRYFSKTFAGSPDKNYYHSIPKMLPAFSTTISLMSEQWDFPDATWREITMWRWKPIGESSKLSSIKPDVKKIWKTVKQCYSFHYTSYLENRTYFNKPYYLCYFINIDLLLF